MYILLWLVLALQVIVGLASPLENTLRTFSRANGADDLVRGLQQS